LVRKLPTLLLAASVAALASVPAAPLRGQGLEPFGIGVTAGLNNAVDHDFTLQSFDDSAASVYFQYEMEEGVVLRLTYGSMNPEAYNSGQQATVGTSPITLPEFHDRINYFETTVGYEFQRTGGWKAGFFAGVGGYKIEPEAVAPEFHQFQDKHQTVWGFCAGLDADFQIWRRFSIVARVEYQAPQTDPTRNLVTASLGVLYRF
jgi:hypothetical protein